jgi:predicted AAA+ superfamily ATPase
LYFRDLNLNNLSLEEKFLLNKLFEEILKYGLFPEVVLQDQEMIKQRLLDEYFDLIYYKDVIERNNFRNFAKLKSFRRVLLSYMSNFVNFTNIAKTVGVSENVILKWFEAFKDAYLVFEIKNFDFSI